MVALLSLVTDRRGHSVRHGGNLQAQFCCVLASEQVSLIDGSISGRRDLYRQDREHLVKKQSKQIGL
jgi:hypothetical protein